MQFAYFNLWDMNDDTYYILAKLDGKPVEILKEMPEKDEFGDTLYDCRIYGNGYTVYETLPSRFLSPAGPSPWFS